MYVTNVMKSRFPVPAYQPGTWVEITEDTETTAYDRDGFVTVLLKGARGVVKSALAVPIVARGVDTPWDYTLQMQSGKTFSDISQFYLKPVPWLVQLALVAVEDGPSGA